MNKEKIKQRQIDTSIGLILGGFIGYTNQSWYLCILLLVVVIAWGYNLNDANEVSSEQ